MEWFIAHASDPEDIARDSDDGSAVLVGLSPQDITVVRLPCELGGEVRVVNGHKKHECPCGKCKSVTHLALGDNLFVARCSTGQFIWYSLKTDFQEECK